MRFEANDYSVPVRDAHHRVVVKGYVDVVCICRKGDVIAEHLRLWDKEDIAFESLPVSGDVRYYIYGDATIRQLDSLGYCTLHKPDASSMKGRLQSLFRAVYRHVYDRSFAKLTAKGHVFLCTSPWYARALMDEHHVPRDQIAILPFCVDSEYWTPASEAAKPDALRILFVGGDFVRKGGDLLLEACKMPAFQDCQFHFVTRMLSLDMPSNARFYTQMSANSTQLRDLVRSCDLFVLPTKGDCSSIALLEAASCALSAIASDIGGIADLVDNGRTGILLRDLSPPAIAEAIQTYRNDRDMLQAHGHAARRKVMDQFDVRVCLAALKRTINGRQRMQYVASGGTPRSRFGVE